MYSRDNTKGLSERKRKLTHRIIELCGAVDQDLGYTFEKTFEENSYAYFAVEEKLFGIKTLFETILNQVKEATTLSELSKVAERVGFVEDRLDEMESQIYNRRRRKQNRFRFSDFFNKYREQIGNGAESEIPSLKDAYDLLGLSGKEGMLEVTATFRRFAKEYHPDARGGDRSCEEQLRRIVGAYQYIKLHFANKP